MFPPNKSILYSKPGYSTGPEHTLHVKEADGKLIKKLEIMYYSSAEVFIEFDDGSFLHIAGNDLGAWTE